MKDKKKLIIIVFLTASILVGVYCGYKIIQHERTQSEQIDSLQKQVSQLQMSTVDDSPAEIFRKAVTDDGFDYLAIGNSITQHKTTDFWWGDWGMAASTVENDYVHRVDDALREQYGTVNLGIYVYYVWEVQANDRTETYELLDEWLTQGIDLVTVQLSENVSDMTTFSEDLKSLIKHIKKKCGDGVHIIVIDDFWFEDKSEVKNAVCNDTNINFVDLSDIREKEEYKAGLGTMVYGDDGEQHVIEHSGVANHPGDEGMKVIAERIMERVYGR